MRRAGSRGQGSARHRPRWEGILAWSCGFVMLWVAIIGFVVAVVVSVTTGANGANTAAAYGRIGIPGSRVVRLPSGRVNLYFDAVTGALSTPAPELSVGVHPNNGRGPDPTITNDVGPTNLYNGEAVIRLARLDVPHPGDYGVSVSGRVGGYLQPRLLLGHDALGPNGGSAWSFGRIMTLTGIAEVVIVLVSLLALVIGRRRQRERVVMAPAAVDFAPPRVVQHAFGGVQVVNASGADAADLVEKLARLRDQGLITEQQFEAARRQVESGGSAGPRYPVSEG